MAHDLTVVYYTAHLETEAFEERTRRALLDALGDLPLISVTQRPLDFGHNICVGEVGACSQNAFRQLQIGAQAATTRFVCNAEADWLYPQEYFTFRPPTDDTVYIPEPIYILFCQRKAKKAFFRKNKSEGVMVVNREHLIQMIDAQLAGYPQWSDPTAPLLDGGKYLPYLLDFTPWERFSVPIPLVTFKTDRNMHRKTPYAHGTGTWELPGWGRANDLIRKYLE